MAAPRPLSLQFQWADCGKHGPGRLGALHGPTHCNGVHLAAPGYRLSRSMRPGAEKEPQTRPGASSLWSRALGVRLTVPPGSSPGTLGRGCRPLADPWQEFLLSGRKRTALSEMRWSLDRYLVLARECGDRDRIEILEALRLISDPESREYSVDRSRLADWWLDRARPLWYEHLESRRRHRPAVLREIRKPLIQEPISTEELATIWEVNLEIPPLDQRVVAAVVGVAGVD